MVAVDDLVEAKGHPRAPEWEYLCALVREVCVGAASPTAEVEWLDDRVATIPFANIREVGGWGHRRVACLLLLLHHLWLILWIPRTAPQCTGGIY